MIRPSEMTDRSTAEVAGGLANAGGPATTQGASYHAELLRRQTEAAQESAGAAAREAEAAERAAAAAECEASAAESAARSTARYTKLTFWIMLFMAITAASAVVSLATGG